MKKSLTKWNKFFSSLFYAVLLALPMLSVLARVVYTQANYNAKDSYYGKNINDVIYNPVSNLRTDLVIGDTYYVNKNVYTNHFTDNIGAYNNGFYVSSFELIETSRQEEFDYSSVTFFAPYFNLQYNGRINLYLRNATTSIIVTYTDTIMFNFVYESNNLNNTWTDTNFIFSLSYNKYSYLDNAFEYSISKVIDDYGKGNINFVNWFGDMFFDNPQNLLYLNFVNMYLNYTLLVSVAYLMYLFLSFFIQIIRELIFSFIDKTNKVGD